MEADVPGRLSWQAGNTGIVHSYSGSVVTEVFTDSTTTYDRTSTLARATAQLAALPA